MLGDQVLYAVLPVIYEDLGLVALEVGILLSANRWIRLLTNELAHRTAHKASPNLLLTSSLLLGAATTAAYYFTASFVVLLAARLLWGFSWSYIRHVGVGSILSSVEGHEVGQTMGWYNGISRAGSVAGLFGGALLVDVLGFHAAILILAAISAIAVPFVWGRTDSIPPEKEITRTSAPGRLLLLGISLGIVGPGFVIATLGAAIADRLDGDNLMLSAATFTGALLAGRYVVDSAAAPFLGASFDRLGFERASRIYFALGGISLIFAWQMESLTIFSLAVVFFFVCATALQAGVAATAGQLGSGAYARYVTASDFGSAAGPLIGWVLVDLFNDVSLSIAIGGGVYFLTTFVVPKLDTPLSSKRSTAGPPQR